MVAKDQVRRNDIDWLRVLGMLTIFLFHCARYFDFDDWHVKNPELSEGLTIFIGVVGQWIMPLFFLLSALGVTYALRSRSDGEYLKERARRLLIPLVFGILFLVPHQVYIERLTHGQFSGNFFAFLPEYFNGWYAFGGNFAWMGLHLWYLQMLFVFSLVTLVLFRRWQGSPGQLRSGINEVLSKPGTILMAAIPIALVELIANLSPETIGRRDFGGWSPLTYLAIFIVGYWVARHDDLQDALYKHRWWAAGLALVFTTCGYLLLESGISSYSPLFSILRGFNTWFWLVGLLGLGRQFLGFRNRILDYANQAVLPFYILHQSVIVLVGFWILEWQTGVFLKFLVLGSISFVLIMLVYELIIRRIGILRLLFGMKR